MRKVPELRFAGFDGEWEEKKLSKIAKFSKGKGYSKNDLSNGKYPIYLYGQMYTNYKSQINEIETYTDSIKVNSILSKGNEVLIPSSGETAEDLSRASHMNISNVLLGGDLNIIEPIDGVNSHFLALELSNGSVKRSLSKKAQGKSVVHLYNSDIKNQKINYTKFEEQEKIGYLFKKLDSLIEIQEGKVSKMEDFKKSMLQKMFPKKDELVPEFRFDGFDGEWESNKIRNIAAVVGGGTPSTNKEEYWNGGINWFSPTEIGDKIFYSESLKKITELGLKKSSAKLLPRENTILFTSRATIGNLGLLTEDATTNQGFQNFVLNNNVDRYFVFSYLQILKTKFIKLSTGSTFKEISKASIESINLKLPKFEEQEKIGQFFKNLDAKIENEKKLLESYKMMKKSLLQKMFV